MTIQLIGFMAMFSGFLSVQFKFRTRILTSQLIANLLWAAHFMLLGATSGAAMNIVGAVRAYIFNKFGATKNRTSYLPAIIIVLFVTATIVTWQGVISLLPFFGMTIATFAFWSRNEQKIRLILLSAAPFWLTYNMLSGSIAGSANETFAIISLGIALWRHRNQGFTVPAVQTAER